MTEQERQSVTQSGTDGAGAVEGPAFRYQYRVQFGDCDPANIVYFPNFYRWMDQATHALCEAAGFELVQVRTTRGWLGFPIAEAGARFLRPATINDVLTVETRVRAWQPRRFLLDHHIRRGDELLVEGWQTRFIGVIRADRGGRLAALEIPSEFQTAIDAQLR